MSQAYFNTQSTLASNSEKLTLNKLSKMDINLAIQWITENQARYKLIQQVEFVRLTQERAYWQKKAIQLANGVGDIYGCFIGEKSLTNCPVNNAIDAISFEKKD